MAALPIRHVPKPSSSQTSHSTLKPGPLSPTFLLSTTPSSDAKDITSLRLHATYIRDTLVPLLSSDRDLPIQEAILLRNILSKISRISPIATDMLRQTRIERALKIIATSGSPWPADTVRQAKVILRRWEKEVGFPLDSIRADLFGRGGRLEGLAPAFQPVAPGDQFVIRDVHTGIALSLTRPPNETASCRTGHLHLTPGDWWINSAAMYRDAVISHPGNGGLTYDRDRAYAVVIEGPEDEETVSVRHGGRGDSDWAPKYPPREVEGTEDILRYKVTRKDARVGKGVFKVMRTMASPDEDRKVVRVFRAWKTVWENAPLGGVRYEGLYRVTNYSIRLSPPNEWTYIFTLAREEAQAPLSTITHIPTPEQMDDWEDYQAMGRQPLKTPQYEVARIHTGMGGLKFVDEKDANERDSGYFSLRNG